MDAKTYPLQEILKPERRYIIPTFQRDYEWTRDEQWGLLFDDLASTADRLLEARAAVPPGSILSASKEQNVSPHFLGAIVCASLPFPTGGVALRSVIDGQQRLTTMQLLVRGLLDVLTETELRPDQVGAPDAAQPFRRRREAGGGLQAVAAAQGPRDLARRHGRRRPLLRTARRTTCTCRRASTSPDAVRDYATTEDLTSDPERLTALADALSSLFKLVVIDLDDNDDAQVIFEVLNGRQTALSAIDLVKNLLFLRGELADDDVEALYDRYWAQFDDQWWKKEVGRGHAARGRRDVLLSAWLTAATGSEANIGHLYREARIYLDGGPSTEDVLKELSAFAAAYRVIYGADPAEDDRLATSYERIRSLDILTAVPLLTWLRTVVGAGLPSRTTSVRSVQWSRGRCGGSMSVGRRAGTARTSPGCFATPRSAFEKGADVADAIVTSLQDGVLAWPSDDDVQEAFATRRFYDNLTQPRIRLLLGAIDRQLRDREPARAGRNPGLRRPADRARHAEELAQSTGPCSVRTAAPCSRTRPTRTGCTPRPNAPGLGPDREPDAGNGNVQP